MKKYHRFAAVCAALCLAATLLLAGCSSTGHPITQGQECSACHNDDRSACEGVSPSNVTEVGMTFSVEIDESQVYLCTARYADEQGETVIPTQVRSIDAAEASAVTVSEPGIYVLCAGDVSSPKMLVVNAAEDGPQDAVVKL